MAKCPGKSVGGILRRKGEIYLIDRKFEPYGWACPAGHLEEGKTPEEMIEIEFGEEIGLGAKPSRLLISETIPWNNCWRSEGGGHEWHVFEMEDPGGDPIADPHEARGGGWFKPRELEEMELEKVWRHFFEKLEIITQRPCPIPESDRDSAILTWPIDVGTWRKSPHFVCIRCGEPAYLNPYTNFIWGCKKCFVRTFSPSIYFKERGNG